MSRAIQKEIKKEFQPYFEDENFAEAWSDWRAICKKKGAVDTVRSWNRHMKHLVELGKGDVELMARIVDQSSDGGPKGAWTKLYAIHDNTFIKDGDY